MPTKLVNGKIKAKTICPFKEKCNAGLCRHEGIEHKVDFSCAFARAFDLMEEVK